MAQAVVGRRGARASELRELARIAGPLAATNAGNLLLGVVDVAVVGRLGEDAIAGAGLGNATFFTIGLFGMGALLGLDPILTQALGAKEPERARRAMGQGAWLALGIFVPLVLLMGLVAVAMPWLGVPSSTVAPAREYLLARAPSLLPFLVLTGVRSYLQATGSARALVWATIAANAVNLPLAIALAFGVPAIGLPSLGVVGAGLAACVATLVQLTIACVPLWRAGIAVRAPLDPALARRALLLGAPIGLQFVAEAGSFAIVTFRMGAFGTTWMGAHQVALQLVSSTFQLALAVAAATTVRVGAAVGEGDVPRTRRAGALGILSGLCVMSVGALAFFVAPEPIARLLTDQDGVVRTAVPLLFVAAWFQLSDGTQTIAGAALRGAGDTRVPLIANLVGHYAIGVPVGLWLAHAVGMGAPGLWWGLFAGLSVVGLWLSARFAVLSRRPIARA